MLGLLKGVPVHVKGWTFKDLKGFWSSAMEHTFSQPWQSSRPISLKTFFTALRAFRIFSIFPTGSWYIIPQALGRERQVLKSWNTHTNHAMMMMMMLLLLDADNRICGERKKQTKQKPTLKCRQHHIEHQSRCRFKPNRLTTDCTSKQVVDKSRVC